jgi:hypothetical protein
MDTSVTASGRKYALGRKLELHTIPGENLETWLAFELLVGNDAEHGNAVSPVSADPAREAIWLAACKIARHLGLATLRLRSSRCRGVPRAQLRILSQAQGGELGPAMSLVIPTPAGVRPNGFPEIDAAIWLAGRHAAVGNVV